MTLLDWYDHSTSEEDILEAKQELMPEDDASELFFEVTAYPGMAFYGVNVRTYDCEARYLVATIIVDPITRLCTYDFVGPST